MSISARPARRDGVPDGPGTCRSRRRSDHHAVHRPHLRKREGLGLDGEAAAEQMYADYRKYSEDLAKAGVIRGGSELKPTTTATTMRVRGGKRQVTDGPFAETKEQLGGFYVIDVPDLESALEWGPAARVRATGPSRSGRSRRWPRGSEVRSMLARTIDSSCAARARGSSRASSAGAATSTWPRRRSRLRARRRSSSGRSAGSRTVRARGSPSWPVGGRWTSSVAAVRSSRSMRRWPRPWRPRRNHSERMHPRSRTTGCGSSSPSATRRWPSRRRSRSRCGRSAGSARGDRPRAPRARGDHGAAPGPGEAEDRRCTHPLRGPACRAARRASGGRALHHLPGLQRGLLGDRRRVVDPRGPLRRGHPPGTAGGGAAPRRGRGGGSARPDAPPRRAAGLPAPGADGTLVPLEEQDRTLWDRAVIGEGTGCSTCAVGRGAPGPYQLQAAIAALHARPCALRRPTGRRSPRSTVRSSGTRRAPSWS